VGRSAAESHQVPRESLAEVIEVNREELLEKHRWLTFVLPLAVFLLAGSLEPKQPAAEASGIAAGWPFIPYACYPLVYALKLALTVAAVLLVLPGYRQFPWRVTPLAVFVGAAGALLWVGICRLHLEARLLEPLGLGKFLDLGVRSAYNPLEELAARPALAWGFFALRWFGMAVVVAVAEEFFVRGFVVRFAVAPDWWAVPFGKVNAAAVLAGTLVPMLMHPAELFAAAAWFSLVTWLMVRTRSIWDCVVAHGVTNLLLGVYVVFSNDWFLI
jgi:CAAX prenyl protease-like protein